MFSDELIKWDRKQAQTLLLLLDKISTISGQVEDNLEEMNSDGITDERYDELEEMESKLLGDLDVEIYNTYSFMIGELKHLERSEAHELAISRIAEWVIYEEEKIDIEIRDYERLLEEENELAESAKKE